MNRGESLLRAIGYAAGILTATLQVAAFAIPVVVNTSQRHNVVGMPKGTVQKMTATPAALGLAALTAMGAAKWPEGGGEALAVLGSWAASTVASRRKAISAKGTYLRQDGLWALASNVISFFATAQAPSRKIENAMLAAGAIVAGYAFIQKAGKDWIPSWGSGDRPTSTMGNPDFYPHYLAMLAPIAAGRVLGGRHPEEKVGWLAYLAGILGAITISRTRGSYLALGAGLATFFLRLDRKTIRENKWWLVGIAVAAAPFVPFLVRKARDLVKAGVGHRSRIWKLGIQAWRKKPILGHGNDTSRPAMNAAKTPDVELGEPGGNYDRAHNQFIDELAMRGGLGLATHLAFWGRAITRGKNGLQRASHAGAIASFLGQNLVSFQVVTTASAAWMIAGMQDEEAKQ